MEIQITPHGPIHPITILISGVPNRKPAVSGHCYNVLCLSSFLTPPLLPASPSLPDPNSHRCCSSKKQKHKHESRIGHLCFRGPQLPLQSAQGGFSSSGCTHPCQELYLPYQDLSLLWHRGNAGREVRGQAPGRLVGRQKAIAQWYPPQSWNSQ